MTLPVGLNRGIASSDRTFLVGRWGQLASATKFDIPISYVLPVNAPFASLTIDAAEARPRCLNVRLRALVVV
ncbi:hypothetical protein [Crateriforma conspicua]|uniref:hypothetical protein n=1 Tax=Crateriforma TaxID=2714592 RepID=UPI0018CF9B7D|nr:hypothetical protein [Crateriforma conspicua]